MPKPFMFLIIGLFFGFGSGFLIAASTGSQLEGHDHDHSNPPHHGGDTAAHGDGHGDSAHAMDHSKLTEVTGPIPELAITLHADGASSRNLKIDVTNFSFSPENVNEAHQPGEGHAHIYVDGVKLARAYSPWFQITGLSAGQHEVRVTLNANDHSQLAVEGEPLEAITTVTIE